jgi:hypothetical protein
MTSYVESCAGKKADFKVFYRQRGKLKFDVMWAKSAEEARANFLKFAAELRLKVEVERVEAIQ